MSPSGSRPTFSIRTSPGRRDLATSAHSSANVVTGRCIRSKYPMIVPSLELQPPNEKAVADPRRSLRPAQGEPSSTEQGRRRIAVVGGGAAGLELATRLDDRVGRRERAEI